MADLRDGDILINNIEISIHSSLSFVLEKTVKLTKTVRDINNYKHLFCSDVLFYDTSGNVRIIFYPNGKIESVSFGLSQSNGCKDKEKLLLFLSKHEIFLTKYNDFYEKYFDWGLMGIYKNINYPEHFSLIIRQK